MTLGPDRERGDCGRWRRAPIAPRVWCDGKFELRLRTGVYLLEAMTASDTAGPLDLRVTNEGANPTTLIRRS